MCSGIDDQKWNISYQWVQDINQKTLSGDTPLHIATLQNSTSFVQYLLECQANPHLSNNQGKTALHIILKSPHNHTIRDLLIREMNDFAATDDEGRTVLYYCTTVEDLELIVKKMVPSILNSKDKNGKTVLAHFIPKVEMIKYLVTLPNLNVNLADHYGVTPMHIAVIIGNLTVIELLLQTGRCNLSLRNIDRRTPLDVAKHLRYTEVINLLTKIINQKIGHD